MKKINFYLLSMAIAGVLSADPITEDSTKIESASLTYESQMPNELLPYASKAKKLRKKRKPVEIAAVDQETTKAAENVSSPIYLKKYSPAEVHVIDATEPSHMGVSYTPEEAAPYVAMPAYSPITDCETCEPCSPTCYPPFAQLGLSYTAGKGIETNKNYGTAELMIFPRLGLGQIVPFISVGAHYLSNHKWAGSYGLGARWQADCCWVAGLNAFYDTIKGDLGTYQQVSIGGEWLSTTWEARANVYLPVGDKHHLKFAQRFGGYDGGYFIKVNTLEQAYRGFDAEIGYNIYFCNNFRLYAGIGPAWYETTYWEDCQWAFKARARLDWCRYLSFEVRTFKINHTCDDKWHWQGVATLWIPFDCFSMCGSGCDTDCGCNWFCDLFSRPVYRNSMPKISKHCCWETNF